MGKDMECTHCTSTSQKNADGWDDDWQSLEIDSHFVENTEKLKSFFPTENDNPFSSLQNKQAIPKNNSSTDVNDWNTSDDWDSWDTNNSKKDSESHLQKQEERRQRQEKRQQLLKERHQAKQKTLGAQKLK